MNKKWIEFLSCGNELNKKWIEFLSCGIELNKKWIEFSDSGNELNQNELNFRIAKMNWIKMNWMVYIGKWIELNLNKMKMNFAITGL